MTSTPIRIFISTVQGEFAQERRALRDYVHDDVLVRRFFDVFLFEESPASDRRPYQLYLDEVAGSDVYLGLFGRQYRSQDGEGVSPTEREFDHATIVLNRLLRDELLEMTLPDRPRSPAQRYGVTVQRDGQGAGRDASIRGTTPSPQHE